MRYSLSNDAAMIMEIAKAAGCDIGKLSAAPASEILKLIHHLRKHGAAEKDGPSPAPRPRATEAMLATPEEQSSARAFEPAIGRDAGEQGKAVAHEPEPRSETKAAPPRSQFDPLTSRFGPRPPELHDVLYYDYVKAQTIRNIARKARHLANLQSIEERASALQMFANLLEDEAASDGAEAS